MKTKISFYTIGLILIGLGVVLTIKADLGAGAWDALNVGLSITIGFTVGSWVIIVGIILIFVNALIQHAKPKFLALMTLFLIGFSVDFWMIFVLRNIEFNTLGPQILALVGGILLIAFGVSLYLQSTFPANPIDQLMLSLHERFHMNLMVAKTITELFALLLAFLLSGPIGVGTIIITFLIGPIIQLFNGPVSKRFEALSKK
ncbi:YczE/YyaS/YitT family protein [Bacillus weihaiensis]|uniref:Permease n=1 Tax=Bacillus weihaiensis TaxID=1547283 RepID=A0A1L3MVI5_9BACI|nr:membrane protein [Bacillus weihaiensis]APH06344.1 hypothetical protein A9C19_17285 [Bacillus weihaiensis]